jgi:hypothetical protein
VGLGLTYNHRGSQDKFLSLHAYRGAEQDGLGANANLGAEGRKRERICLMGQWAEGPTTLQVEVSLGRESYAASAILGAVAPVTAPFRGYGLIFKRELRPSISCFGRLEWLTDDFGVRLAADPSIRESLGLGGAAGLAGAGLRAQSLSLGVEKKHGPAFARIEVRQDRLNRDLKEAQGAAYREGLSATVSLGASF